MLRGLFRRRASVADVVDLDDAPFHVTTQPMAAGFQTCAVDDDGNPVWPDDPDEVPAWWYERQAWATINGTKLPPYRTRREMEHAVAAIIDRMEGQQTPQIVGPFSPELAARKFIDHLRSSNPGTLHEYSANELTTVYSEYCTEANIAPTHVDSVKAVLAMLPGVERSKARRMIDGKRTQCVTWLIRPFEPQETEVIDDDDPVDIDEPIRMAA